MSLSLAQIKRYRYGFGWAFLVSIAVLSASAWYFTTTSRSPTADAVRVAPRILIRRPGMPAPASRPPAETATAAAAPWLTPAMLTAIASLLTSLASLGGFFLALRKERHAKAMDRGGNGPRRSRRR